MQAELSSLDYQDSIYTTASSNFEDHIQNRMVGPNQSPQGIRNASVHDGETQTSTKYNSEAIVESVPTLQQPTSLSASSIEEAIDTQGDQDQVEKGSEVVSQEETERFPGELAALEAAAISPSSQTISISKKRPHISIDTSQLDLEDNGQLKKDGPNPFASPNPFAVSGDCARDLERCTTRTLVPTEESVEEENCEMDRGEKTVCSPSASAADSLQGMDSPKPFRMMEGGFHGMMVGLYPSRYEELKENPPSQSLPPSEANTAHTMSSKTADPPSTAVSQFKVPEFASKRLSAAFRTIKSASGHLMEKAARTSGEVGLEEDPGAVESGSATEAKVEQGDLQHTSWRGTLRRGFRQNGSIDEEKLEDGEQVDIIL